MSLSLTQLTALRLGTVGITEFKGAERIAYLRLMINQPFKAFVDLKGGPVKNDTQQWFVGPRKQNANGELLFCYAMLDTAERFRKVKGWRVSGGPPSCGEVLRMVPGPAFSAIAPKCPFGFSPTSAFRNSRSWRPSSSPTTIPTTIPTAR